MRCGSGGEDPRTDAEQSGRGEVADLAKVCDHYFGEPRQEGTSHRVYPMPWQGDPRVNIQDDHGSAKPYQVKQVLEALARLKLEEDNLSFAVSGSERGGVVSRRGGVIGS